MTFFTTYKTSTNVFTPTDRHREEDMAGHEGRDLRHRRTAVPTSASEDRVAVRGRDHAMDVRNQLQGVPLKFGVSTIST